MRKDIQFGLIIGGSIIGALAICVTVFDRGNVSRSPVSLVPATQPALDVTSAAPPAPDATSTLSPARIDVSAPVPATQPAVADTSTAADWTRLLQNGGSTTQPTTVSTLAASGATTQPSSGRTGGATAVAAASAPTTSRTHKVQAGETFYTIATQVYGDGKYYNHLVDANPTIAPSRLRIGMVINVPDLNGTTPTAPVSSATAIQAGARAEIDSTKSYRVQASDTLMAISRRLYGNGGMWEKIYEANKDVIGDNPARLKVNMVLRLPEPPTVAAAN
jgi:nucleoid-associated protein YgaU